MSDLDYLSALDLASDIRQKRLSVVEVVQSFLLAIEERNDTVNAYVNIIADQALEAAVLADERVSSGEALGPLHGVPLAIKDLFDFKAGVRASLGSRVFRTYVPKVSATYVDRLERAGAIVLGKTNTPELGHKATTDNLLFGSTRNPFDLTANAGGSSGGSAAAVAEGLAPISQGSDGGGSVRIPASMCGVFGLKPTFGRIASATPPNLFVKHSPFLHPGPITRTVDDAALMLDVMAGPHRDDPFALPHAAESNMDALRQDIAGSRVAYSPDLGIFPVEPAVTAVVEEALTALEIAGAVVEHVEIRFPISHEELTQLWHREIGQTYVDFLLACEGEGLYLLRDHKGDLDPNVVLFMESALTQSVVQIKKDEQMRSQVLVAVEDLLSEHEFLVTPTIAVERVPNSGDGMTLGPTVVNGAKVDPFIGWCLTYPFNFTGHPAASVPAGRTPRGMPIGMQVVGRRFRDDRVLAFAANLGRIRPWDASYATRRAGVVSGPGR